MSEVVSYYRVSNVHVIRVVCHHQGCYAAIELPTGTVEAVMKKTGGCCPVCGRPFVKPDVEGGADVITMLARVAIALQGLTGQVRIELPITENIE